MAKKREQKFSQEDVIKNLHGKIRLAEDTIKTERELVAFWANKYGMLLQHMIWYANEGYTIDQCISEWLE